MIGCNHSWIIDLLKSFHVRSVIKKIFRSDAKKESVTYQEILLEGEVEGKIEERTQIALNMMRSGLELGLIAQFIGLTPEQIQKLQ